MESVQQGGRRSNVRLPPEVNRFLYVRNLPFKITPEDMFDIFGKYGAIRQIRLYVPPSLNSLPA
jgi:pre-mRNA branch site protein p14